MTISTTRRQRRQLAKDNLAWPERLMIIPRDQWPVSVVHDPRLFRAMRSRHFLVQLWAEENGIIRMSVNRTIARADGRWEDGITWDELQRLKAESGYADDYAVEIFPARRDLVDVANVRHLWLLPEPPPFAWRREPPASAEGC